MKLPFIPIVNSHIFYELMFITRYISNHEKMADIIFKWRVWQSLHPQTVCPVSCGGQCEHFDDISFNKNIYKRLFKCSLYLWIIMK